MPNEDSIYLLDRDRIFDRFDSINKRFDRLEERFDTLNVKIEKLITHCHNKQCPKVVIAQECFNKQADSWFHQKIGIIMLGIFIAGITGSIITKLFS